MFMSDELEFTSLSSHTQTHTLSLNYFTPSPLAFPLCDCFHGNTLPQKHARYIYIWREMNKYMAKDTASGSVCM